MGPGKKVGLGTGVQGEGHRREVPRVARGPGNQLSGLLPGASWPLQSGIGPIRSYLYSVSSENSLQPKETGTALHVVQTRG